MGYEHVGHQRGRTYFRVESLSKRLIKSLDLNEKENPYRIFKKLKTGSIMNKLV